MDVPPNWVWYDEENGGCKYIAEDGELYRCSLGKAGRAFRCAGNSPHSTVEYCQVRFAKISKKEATKILMSAT